MSQPARGRRPLLLVWWALFVAAVAVVPVSEASAAPLTTGGFTTSVGAAPARVTRGATVSIDVTVTADAGRQALVDLEIYGPSGAKVFQHWWDGQSFAAGQARTLSASWTVPTGEPRGVHTVRIGVFSPGWGTLFHWNNDATTFRVSTSTTPPPPPSTTTTSTTSTTAPPTTSSSTTSTTTSTSTTTTTTSTTAPPSGGRFQTLPVGATLPSDATCASLVRDAAEIRPANATFNQTRGQQNPGLPDYYGRVTGNFVGSTDEIIQWAACKWGIDEDIVRAQTAKESWWFQRSAGDFTSDPTRCVPGHPIGADGRPGQCPESIGVQQLRYPYWGWAFPHATTSTAYNLDAAMAARRRCFDGYETWLNTVDRGREYAAGDLWGCVGAWFSGRWYTQPSVTYIGEVQDYLAQRLWEQPVFIGAT